MSWWDHLTPAQVKALDEKFPHLTMQQIALLAMAENPEPFDQLGVLIDGKPPSEYFRVPDDLNDTKA